MSEPLADGLSESRGAPARIGFARRGILLLVAGLLLFLSLWAAALEFSIWTHSGLFSSGALRVLGALCVLTAAAISLTGVVVAIFAPSAKLADPRVTLLFKAQFVGFVLLLVAVVPWFLPHHIA